VQSNRLEKEMLTSFQKKALCLSLLTAFGAYAEDGVPVNNLSNRTDIAYTNHARQNVDINLVFNRTLNLNPQALVSATVSGPQKNLGNHLFEIDPNTATTNGSVAGVSGNAGVNNAAGVYNQQANNVTIAHGNSGTTGFIARTFSNTETQSRSRTHSDSDTNSWSWSRAAASQFADSASHTHSDSRTVATNLGITRSSSNSNLFSRNTTNTNSNSAASAHNSSNSAALTASLNANAALSASRVNNTDTSTTHTDTTTVVVPPPPVSFVSTTTNTFDTVHNNDNAAAANLTASLSATLSRTRANSASDTHTHTDTSNTTTAQLAQSARSRSFTLGRTTTATDTNTESDSHSRSASRSFAAARSHSDSNADTSSFSDTRTSSFTFAFYQPLGVAVESSVSYEQLSDGNVYTSINPNFPNQVPAGPVNNTAAMNGSVVGVTGNAGVNTAAGVGNQQENNLALANTAEYSVLAAATAGGFQVNSGNTVNIVGPLTNSSTMSGSIVGVSGNVGVNTAAGFSNQQVNALSIAASSR
jgi:hypothetical protein